MARNPWQILRKAVRTTRIKKTLTIPAFSYACGSTNRSLQFTAGATSATDIAFTGAGYSLASAFTLDFWFKPSGFATTAQYLVSNYMNTGGLYQVRCYLLNGKIVVDIRKGGAYTNLVSNDYVSNQDWNHVSVVYDGATLKIYLNLVLQTNTATLAAPLTSDGGNIYILYLGSGNAANNLYQGYIDEVRVYDAALTYDQILYRYNKRRSTSETNLQYYVKCDDSGYTVTDSVSGSNTTIPSADRTSVMYSDDTYAPLRLGASFACGKFAIAVGTPCSLVFPVEKPEDANFMPVLLWQDDDDEWQRRRLWDMDGVDYEPLPAIYQGEKLNATFYVEILNVDGNESVDLTDDLVIETSLTTTPTSEIDVTPLVAATPTADTTLAENFPLSSFPLAFNTQQTY